MFICVVVSHWRVKGGEKKVIKTFFSNFLFCFYANNIENITFLSIIIEF
jgi:hypothetical protein